MDSIPQSGSYQEIYKACSLELEEFLPIRSVKDFLSCVVEKHELVFQILDTLVVLEDPKFKSNQKIEELELRNSKLLSLLDLQQKSFGTHSMYKGLFEEKKIEIILTEYFGEFFQITHEIKTKKMDILMKHKSTGFLIGVECKNKKKITREDIDKFKRDKRDNEFDGGIFISTKSPIPYQAAAPNTIENRKTDPDQKTQPIMSVSNFHKKRNTYWIHENELYIFSDDSFLIYIFILNFIQSLCSRSETLDQSYHLETICELYKQWSKMKRMFVDSDKIFIQYLKRANLFEVLGQRHLYLTHKTKCKRNNPPYC